MAVHARLMEEAHVAKAAREGRLGNIGQLSITSDSCRSFLLRTHHHPMSLGFVVPGEIAVVMKAQVVRLASERIFLLELFTRMFGGFEHGDDPFLVTKCLFMAGRAVLMVKTDISGFES